MSRFLTHFLRISIGITGMFVGHGVAAPSEGDLDRVEVLFLEQSPTVWEMQLTARWTSAQRCYALHVSTDGNASAERFVVQIGAPQSAAACSDERHSQLWKSTLALKHSRKIILVFNQCVDQITLNNTHASAEILTNGLPQCMELKTSGQFRHIPGNVITVTTPAGFREKIQAVLFDAGATVVQPPKGRYLSLDPAWLAQTTDSQTGGSSTVRGDVHLFYSKRGSLQDLCGNIRSRLAPKNLTTAGTVRPRGSSLRDQAGHVCSL